MQSESYDHFATQIMRWENVGDVYFRGGCRGSAESRAEYFWFTTQWGLAYNYPLHWLLSNLINEAAVVQFLCCEFDSYHLTLSWTFSNIPDHSSHLTIWATNYGALVEDLPQEGKFVYSIEKICFMFTSMICFLTFLFVCTGMGQVLWFWTLLGWNFHPCLWNCCCFGCYWWSTGSLLQVLNIA